MTDAQTTDLKSTVNLPKTDLSIRAGLAELEPEILRFWDRIGLSDRIIERQEEHKKRFVFHDGPPHIQMATFIWGMH